MEFIEKHLNVSTSKLQIQERLYSDSDSGEERHSLSDSEEGGLLEEEQGLEKMEDLTIKEQMSSHIEIPREENGSGKPSGKLHIGSMDAENGSGKVDGKLLIGSMDTENGSGKVDGKLLIGSMDTENGSGKVDGKLLIGSMDTENGSGKVDGKLLIGSRDIKNETEDTDQDSEWTVVTHRKGKRKK